MSLFAELKRRNVFRVAVAYVVASWVLLQITDVMAEILALPDWAPRLILLILAIGFIPTVIFAWAYELTPEGLNRERDVERSTSITRVTAKKLDIVTIGLVLLAIALLVADRVWQPAPVRHPIAAPAPVTDAPAAQQDLEEDQRSIAVLPFRDMSPAQDQAWFGEGIAEELLNALVGVEGLRVASRTSSFSLASTGLSLPEIAQQLNVNHVLEGSVRTGGERMRITAQLIDVASDTHLWSETYDREIDDVLAVQDEIAQHVAGELQVRLGAGGAEMPASLTETLTENPEAFQHYIRGRHYWRKRNIEDLVRAAKELETAVDLDPEFARAWSNLAIVYTNIPEYAADENYDHASYYERANQAARQALLLDASLGEARAVLAGQMFQRCEPANAARAYESAIEADPDDPTLHHWYALSLLTYGLSSRASEHAHEAYRLDPLNAAIVSTVGDALSSQGDIEGGLGFYGDARDLGIFGGSQYFVAYLHALRGDLATARDLLLAEERGMIGLKSTAWVEPWIEALENPDRVPAYERRLQELLASDGLAGWDIPQSTLAPLGSPLYFKHRKELDCSERTPFDHYLFWHSSEKLRTLPEFRAWLDHANARELYEEFGWPDVCQGDAPEAWCSQ